MAKVMQVEVTRHFFKKNTVTYSDMVDDSIDNLDDLLIEHNQDTLIYVADNAQSPKQFGFNLLKQGESTVAQVTQPEHPLHQAPLLTEWITENQLCASEIPFKNGIIMVQGTYDKLLLEEF